MCRVCVGDSFSYDSLTDTPVDPITDKRRYLEARIKEHSPPTPSAQELNAAVRKLREQLQPILARFGEALSAVIPCKMFLQVIPATHGNPDPISQRGAMLLQIRLGAQGGVTEMCHDTTEPLPEPYYLVRVPDYIFVDLVMSGQWDWEEAFLGDA